MASVITPPPTQSSLVEVLANTPLVNQAQQGANVASKQLVMGKQFEAEVMASLKDGTNIVKVADIVARMQLPYVAEVGAKMQLTLVSTSPRIAFLLNVPDKPITAAATASTAGQAPITDADGNSPAPNTPANALFTSTATTVSSAGKFIGQLIQQAPEENRVTKGRLPLLDGPDVNVSNIAKALQGGVKSSGVFYEAHLLKWVEGAMNVAELMKEPQASFTAQARNMPEHLMNMATLPKEAASLIQQQLQTLEQQRFMWQGQVWPGQAMRWEISRDTSHQHAEQEEKAWQSTMTFSLAHLGSVSAQLQLVGDKLKLTVQGQDEAITHTLQNHSNDLITALEGSGAKLESLLIQTKKPADE